MSMRDIWKWLRAWVTSEWRVLYPDGKWSMVMPRHIAKGYAEIFKGTVRPASEFDPYGQ